jgi:kinesin family protein 5
MSTKLNELRLQVERLDYEAKEGNITIETLREQNNDTTIELEALKKQIAEVKATHKDASADDKEKRKQEKMALMMAKFDTVRIASCRIFWADCTLRPQQGAFSEKDEQLRQLLMKLDNMDNEGAGALSSDDLTAIRRQLAEGQTVLRETLDRLRQSQEETEMVVRRKDELDARVAQLEADYEELLGKSITYARRVLINGSVNREDYP